MMKVKLGAYGKEEEGWLAYSYKEGKRKRKIKAKLRAYTIAPVC